MRKAGRLMAGHSRKRPDGGSEPLGHGARVNPGAEDKAAVESRRRQVEAYRRRLA